MSRYIYHYSSHYEDDGSVFHIDGIATLENKIMSHECYLKLKKEIEPEHSNKLTISSLNLLGREGDE